MATFPHFTVLFLLPLVCFESCGAIQADTWDVCNCTFEEWLTWETCSTDCFGQRVRERSVSFNMSEECQDTTDCVTEDERFEWGSCNTVCHNNGIITGNVVAPCSCANGYYGLCCTDRVDCGTPETITNGNVSAATTDYDSAAVYTCDPQYNLTNGHTVRYCQNNFTWSGTAPQCVYADNCTSMPCKNGATCVNLLTDFRCDCAQGWSGQLCDVDVQPPVVEGCSGDVVLNATTRTIRYNWTAPVFADPMGTEIEVISNYNTYDFMFPWGDNNVSYTATKLLNGLQTQCTFQVKVRPTPCNELSVPVNGAKICNGWRTDYGLYCMMACMQNYTLTPNYSFLTWRVCGASGTWIPAIPFPDCSLHVYTVEDAIVYQPEHQTFVYQSACQDPAQQSSLKQLYINQLEAYHGLASVCTMYPDQCIPENVIVTC